MKIHPVAVIRYDVVQNVERTVMGTDRACVRNCAVLATEAAGMLLQF